MVGPKYRKRLLAGGKTVQLPGSSLPNQSPFPLHNRPRRDWELRWGRLNNVLQPIIHKDFGFDGEAPKVPRYPVLLGKPGFAPFPFAPH